MIRLLARLAPPNFDSVLANECFGVEEYLDCDCSAAKVDQTLEAELEALPGPQVADAIVRALARRFRSALPSEQPSRGH